MELMEIKNKGNNIVLPYTYLLKFNYNNSIHYYYGVRYGNVTKNIKPIDDLFVNYFTSSNTVKKLLEENILPFEIIIHKTFKNIELANDYEIAFLKRVNAKNRTDFLNKTDRFNNYIPYQTNKGTIKTPSEREKMSEISSKTQNDEDYKKFRTELMKSKWNDYQFKEYMNEKNKSFWSSSRGIELKKILKERNISNTGLNHSNITKQKMSESAKLACSKIDCSERAMNRKRYICPICSMPNLDGSNFNKHMNKSHNWETSYSQQYKLSF